MSNKEEIQILLLKHGISMSELVRKINTKYGRNTTVQNFYKKLIRGTLRYSEFKELADILGYEVKLVPKEDD